MGTTRGLGGYEASFPRLDPSEVCIQFHFRRLSEPQPSYWFIETFLAIVAS